jgi:hypothetical protein
LAQTATQAAPLLISSLSHSASPSRPNLRPWPKANRRPRPTSFSPAQAVPAATSPTGQSSPPQRDQALHSTHLNAPHYSSSFSLPLTTGERHIDVHGGSVISGDASSVNHPNSSYTSCTNTLLWATQPHQTAQMNKTTHRMYLTLAMAAWPGGARQTHCVPSTRTW